jgi:hypothetical protein
MQLEFTIRVYLHLNTIGKKEFEMLNIKDKNNGQTYRTLYTVLMLIKGDVSETGKYLRPQAKPKQLGPIDEASPYLDRTETDSSL